MESASPQPSSLSLSHTHTHHHHSTTTSTIEALVQLTFTLHNVILATNGDSCPSWEYRELRNICSYVLLWQALTVIIELKWHIPRSTSEVILISKQWQEGVTLHASHLSTYVGNSQQINLLYSDIPGMVGSTEAYFQEFIIIPPIMCFVHFWISQESIKIFDYISVIFLQNCLDSFRGL